MEKLKKYKYVILVVIFLAFAFYWYSYRPYNISKLCMNIALEKIKEIAEDQIDVRYFFWKCQKQHGIIE